MGARRLYQKLRKAQTFAREFVEPWRRRTAQFAPTIGTKITISDIIA
ncbi:MAG: hypothetical protein WCC84_03480 [Candidatus Cybelea sp.]